MRAALDGYRAARKALEQMKPDVVMGLPRDDVDTLYKGFLYEPESEEEAYDTGTSLLNTASKVCSEDKRTFIALSSKDLPSADLLTSISMSRIPLVAHVANVHGKDCDHTEVMEARNTGWVQLFCETAQEVYDLSFIALKMAEKSSLPVMVCQDFLTTTHAFEPVELHENAGVKKFISTRPKKTRFLDWLPFFSPSPEDHEDHAKAVRLALDQFARELLQLRRSREPMRGISSVCFHSAFT